MFNLEDIQTYNEESGYHKACDTLTSIINSTNFLIIICSVLIFLNQMIDIGNIPEFIKEYKVNLFCALNAVLLLVLTNGHNRYFIYTTKMVNLSDYIFLRILDLVIKISLSIVSVLQCISIDSFIGICMYGYLLTFIRVFYLNKVLDKKHPLLKKIKETWYPNNIRHVLVMLIWFLGYYGLLKTNWIYYLVTFLAGSSIDFSDQEVDKCLYIVQLLYLIIFDCYWIFRNNRKIIIQKNKTFMNQSEDELMKEVREYYATNYKKNI